MGINETLMSYEPLIRHAVSKVLSRVNLETTVTTKDDLLNEARIAAWKAIESYSEGHRVKLSTYIFQCVTNRMISIKRTDSRMKRSADLSPIESAKNVEEKSFFGTFVSLLDKEERELMARLYDGEKIPDIISSERRINRLKHQKTVSPKKVRECLRRLQQKLEYVATSQNR